MKIEIPEKHRIQILDVICACEDDMERVAFCWQFAQNYAKESSPYSIEYVESLKNQIRGLEETVADLKQELKQHYS
jgi:hypothetical protein